MTKQVKYRQCTLVKNRRGVTFTKVSWIPSNFAKIKKILKLKYNDKWEDGWEVVSASEKEVEEQHLPDSHKAIKGHRKMTGDSIPKVK